MFPDSTIQKQGWRKETVTLQKIFNFPAAIFSNTFDRRGAIEIGLWSQTSEEEDSFGKGTTSANLQHAGKLPSLTRCLKILANLGASSQATSCKRVDAYQDYFRHKNPGSEANCE